MECRRTHFWLGLAIGTTMGCIAARLCRTQKAKELKAKVCDALRNAGQQAGDMLNNAKDKVNEAGFKAADKVSDKAYEYANKMDDKMNKK